MIENILVCVSNPTHAERLIQRGKIIADTFGGECVVLYVYKTSQDQLEFNEIQTKMLFKTLANKYNVKAVFEYSNGKKVSTVIANIATEKNITQIVLGQCVQTKFELMVRHSMINELFQQLEGVDIHLVEVSRDIFNQVSTFDRGIHAHLSPKDNEYELTFDSHSEHGIDGVFFKETSTDFLNGFFVIPNEDEHIVVRVSDGKVTELEKIKK